MPSLLKNYWSGVAEKLHRYKIFPITMPSQSPSLELNFRFSWAYPWSSFESVLRAMTDSLTVHTHWQFFHWVVDLCRDLHRVWVCCSGTRVLGFNSTALLPLALAKLGWLLPTLSFCLVASPYKTKMIWENFFERGILKMFAFLYLAVLGLRVAATAGSLVFFWSVCLLFPLSCHFFQTCL